MIIEIGTSDFRTKAGIEDGLFIEPVKYYFDKLPECNKLNIAISDKEGEATVYYLPDYVIKEYNMPIWVKGCNSINQIHPTALKVLRQHGLTTGVIQSHKVQCKRIKDVLEEQGITEFDTLKVDAEGMDALIVSDYLSTVKFRPKTIIYEANELSCKLELLELANRLNKEGYKLTKDRDNLIWTS